MTTLIEPLHTQCMHIIDGVVQEVRRGNRIINHTRKDGQNNTYSETEVRPTVSFRVQDYPADFHWESKEEFGLSDGDYVVLAGKRNSGRCPITAIENVYTGQYQDKGVYGNLLVSLSSLTLLVAFLMMYGNATMPMALQWGFIGLFVIMIVAGMNWFFTAKETRELVKEAVNNAQNNQPNQK
ncbi:MAG: hypothetical protein AAGC47_07565 [Bacteroidota bacterium]